jgi:hypothetical protein
MRVDHKEASGIPEAVQEVDREPVLDLWEEVETWHHPTPHIRIGMEQRWHRKGTGKQLLKEYRAFASIGMPEYPGNKTVYSTTFEAHDAMDVVRVTGYSANPQALQSQADIAAAVARSHKQHGQAAPSDVKKLAQDMAFDLLMEYRPWQVKYDRHMARLVATESLRAQVAAIAEDIRENGLCPEYESFVSDIKDVSILLEQKF